MKAFFGNLPWYVFLILAIICAAVVVDSVNDGDYLWAIVAGCISLLNAGIAVADYKIRKQKKGAA